MNTPVETIATCPLCGEPLRENPEACSKCDWIRGYRSQENFRVQLNTRDVAAAALSIVPGAGHIFKGYKVLGALMLVGVPVICIFAFAFTMFFGWLLVPTYWIAVAADAFLRKDLETAKTPPLVSTL